jgi:hypothetical protein
VGDEKTAASEQFQKLKQAHAKLMAASQNPSEQKLALAQCCALCSPVVSAYYENYSVTPRPVTVEGSRIS